MRNATATKRSFDALVVGAGPAGLVAATLLARQGLDTVCLGVGPVPVSDASYSQPDPRTSALMRGAINLLANIGVWHELQPSCAPLQRLRLIDATRWMMKAPTVEFDAAEIGEEPFGWNIPNAELLRVLEMIAVESDHLTREMGHALHVDFEASPGEVVSSTGIRLSAPLIVAADGRASLCRDAAKIGTSSWSYPQAAIACSLAHEKPHNDTSIEFHRPPGPLTLVPLPGNRSSLVCVEEPSKAREYVNLEAADFENLLEEVTGGVLGSISQSTPRGMFKLSGLTAKRFSKGNVALIGEAAHVLPPIGAQGLNLGIRDAAVLAELVENMTKNGSHDDFGDVLDAYDRQRRRDVVPRTALVDLLNRSLYSGTAALQGLRGAGLYMLNFIGPLRREFMRQGMEPAGDLPRIMRSTG